MNSIRRTLNFEKFCATMRLPSLPSVKCSLERVSLSSFSVEVVVSNLVLMFSDSWNLLFSSTFLWSVSLLPLSILFVVSLLIFEFLVLNDPTCLVGFL